MPKPNDYPMHSTQRSVEQVRHVDDVRYHSSNMPEVRETPFAVPVVWRRNRTTQKEPFVPLPTHDLLIEAVLRYRLLTNEQLTRLFYKPGMLTTVITRTKRLREAGLLQAIYLGSQSVVGGSATVVYTLARAGLNRMKAAGYRVPSRYNPNEVARLGKNPEWVRSRLAENDVLISLELLTKQVPAIRFLPPPEHFAAPGLLVHEWNLKRRSPTVRITVGSADEPHTQRRTVTFDGWAQLHVTATPAYARASGHTGYEQALALETDRDSEEQKAWRTKCAAIVALAESGYQEHFGAPSLVVAVIAVPNPSKLILPLGTHHARRQADGRASITDHALRRATDRMAELVRWTEAELKRLYELRRTRLSWEELTQLFCFTAADAARIAPAELWLAPRWREPFGKRPLSVVEDVADFHP
jgi:hypothetical protein